MSEPLSIRDLLARGAKPSAEDAANLKRIATFVSRYFSQVQRALPSQKSIGVVGMEPGNTKGTLVHQTVGRWSQALGGGVSMLADAKLNGHWELFSGDARAGYGRGDWDNAFFEQVSVLDEDGEVIFEDSGAQPERRRQRRRSLFGPRADGQRRRQTVSSTQGNMTWGDGGSRINVGVVQALSDGGLRLVDQLVDEEPFSRTDLSLDGLLVDGRTPALWAALNGAESGLSRARDVDGMLSTRTLGANVGGYQSASPAVERPVFSFFDAVEGDFLALLPDVQSEGLLSGDDTNRGHAHSTSAVKGLTNASPTRTGTGIVHSTRQAVQLSRVARMRPQRPAVTLSDLVRRAGKATAGSSPVRPYVSGIYGEPAFAFAASSIGSSRGVSLAPKRQPARLAQQVVRDRAGRAVPRLQRSGLGAPRLSYLEVASGGVKISDAKWALAADGGPDLPLGALLSDGEMFASNVLSRHPTMSSFEGNTMVGGTDGGKFGYRDRVDALDGVSWVALEQNSDSGTQSPALGLSLVPEGRPATMMGSNIAYELMQRTGAVSEELTGSGPENMQGSRTVHPLSPTARILRAAAPLVNTGSSVDGTALWSGSDNSDQSISRASQSAPYQRLFSRGYLAEADFHHVAGSPEGKEPGEIAQGAFGTLRVSDGHVLASSDVITAARLRNVLRRPVVTARERFEASSGLTNVLTKLAAHTPGLARVLSTPRVLAGGAFTGADLTSVEVVQELASLSNHKRRVLAEGFLSAGWSSADLRMLNLDSVSDAASEQSTGSPRRGPSKVRALLPSGTGSSRTAASNPTASTAPSSERIVRNLARVLTGTEALLGGLKAKKGNQKQPSGGLHTNENRGVAAGLASFIPLLRTKPNAYFGAMAPETRVAYTTLSDALSELVSLAVSEHERSDKSVTASGQNSALSQFERVKRAQIGVDVSMAKSASRMRSGSGEPVHVPIGASAETLYFADQIAAPPVKSQNAAYAGSLGLELSFVQQGARLENRLNRALAGAAKGPAGITRLIGSQDNDMKRTQRLEPLAASSPVDATGKSDVRLTQVLAPEVMLHGVTGVRTGRVHRETPGALASLGVDEWSMTPARELGATGAASRPIPSLSDPETRSRFAQDVRRAGGHRQKDSGLTPQVIGRILSRLDERQNPAVMSRADSGEFALAWLRRVDGQLSGIDTGLGESAESVASFFGLSETRTSSVASDSPVFDAKLVAPGAKRDQDAMTAGEDRSGLRNLGASLESKGRSTQSKSSAFSGVDWDYINTGSSASTSHVDMQALTAGAMASSDISSMRMPLVAPAAKAVAQAAMRSSKSEEAPASEPAVQQAPLADDGAAGNPGTSGGMDDKAMDQLAQEMAGRISRRMAREKDRRGLWA